jgi:hypothetical protein
MIKSSEYLNKKDEIDDIVENYEQQGYQKNVNIWALENGGWLGVFKRPHSKDLDKFNNQVQSKPFKASIDLLRSCLIYPSVAEYDYVVSKDFGFTVGVATKLIEKLNIEEETTEKKL